EQPGLETRLCRSSTTGRRVAAEARRARHRRHPLRGRPRHREQHRGGEHLPGGPHGHRQGDRRRRPRRAGHRALDVRDHAGPRHARAPSGPDDRGRRREGAVRRLQRVRHLQLPAGGGAHRGHLRRQRGCPRAGRARAARAGRGGGDRCRLPRQPALPRRGDHRRDDAAVGRRARRGAGHPRHHPRPGRDCRGVHRARGTAGAARHQLLHRLDRLAGPGTAGGLEGLGAAADLRAARRRRRRRAGDRRRPQRHRDDPVGRSRCRDGSGAARGAGGGGLRHRDGARGRGSAGARPLVL
ncbi:MAG: HAD-superfamily hydrolase, subfamily IIB, partial [uncultured Nocardioidaceae bacterium]